MKLIKKKKYRIKMYDRPMGQNLFVTDEEKLETIADNR